MSPPLQKGFVLPAFDIISYFLKYEPEVVGMKDRVTKLHNEGFNCAQIVFSSFSEKLGMDCQLAKKVAACFGGGMSCGEVCGAVTGALMVIGLKYGNYLPHTPEIKKQCAEKNAEFREKFLEEYDSIICRELLGYDISIPEEKEIIKEKGLFENFCSDVITYAIEVLNTIL